MKTIFTPGYRLQFVKFKTAKKDKQGAPVFEELIIRNYCSIPRDKMQVYNS